MIDSLPPWPPISVGHPICEPSFPYLCWPFSPAQGSRLPPKRSSILTATSARSFRENCFQCHGFDEKARQAELRLDTPESALVKHDDITPIVPGHPDQSELWRRITTDDESEMMPPPDSHRALKPEQKQLLKRWIEQGAAYDKHWSFIPPVKADVPEVSDKSWPRNEIDNFILDRLDAEKLSPCSRSRSPHADPPPLARPHRPAALGRRCRSLRRRRRPERLRKTRRLAFSPAPTSANAWPSSGSTPPATPTPTATRSTAAVTFGCGATGSSTPSTRTCRTTSSSASNSPAT